MTCAFAWQRGKWWWNGELQDTWMSWESPEEGYHLEQMAEKLSTYLHESFGWETAVEDWFDDEAAVVGADAAAEADE